jgi:hypothetical protein
VRLKRFNLTSALIGGCCPRQLEVCTPHGSVASTSFGVLQPTFLSDTCVVSTGQCTICGAYGACDSPAPRAQSRNNGALDPVPDFDAYPRKIFQTVKN